MLEETLSSTTRSPAEVALTLLSFVEVELAAGGASAEKRFFNLFSMLCDRVFGPLSQNDDCKHEFGGWLGRYAKWERPNTSISSSPHRLQRQTSSSSQSVKTDPVVRLLGAQAASSNSSKEQQHALSLIEAFAKEAEHRPNVRYHFPFRALPKSTQDAWIALIEASLGGTPSSDLPPGENSSRLLGSLLRVKPLDQIQLRNYHQSKAQKKDQKRPLQLSPMYNSPKSTQSSSTSISKGKETPPKILLSMLEYYLMVFVRYPLAAPPPPKQNQATTTTRGGIVVPVRRAEPYGETVYYQLFQEYVDYYIPASAPQGHSNGFMSLQRPSELFLRFVIELWLDGQNQLASTSKAIKAIEERRPGTTFDLNLSYDLVKGKYEPPPYQIPRCLHKLVARAASDGAILDLVQDVHGGFRGPNPEILCLNPAMTILQVPFYNYIRNTFRHASIHAKQSPFYSALNDWLMWLEPWNTRHIKGNGDPAHRIIDTVSRTSQEQTSSTARVTYPRASHRSLYKPCWEPYIASNLHLYTVPLAIFLRRARELDFSPREYHHSMNTVKRVFRVFNPEVMAVINKLLASRNSDSPLSEIVTKHEKLLGAHAPPSTSLSLESCQHDMHNLLEEICLQHLKKVEALDFIDRGIAWIEGLFGQGAYAGEEKELQSLVEKAKVIVGFGLDYEVIPASRSRSNETVANGLDSSYIDRTNNGIFSDEGRERLFYGLSKCDAQDIDYIGDRMFARPQSHEISWLVPVLVSASQFLNGRLGIETSNSGEGMEKSFLPLPKRFNLRFLASYRNICFICMFIWYCRR